MGVKSGSGMTSNSAMFATMLFGAVFRRKSRALMAVVATLVGAATLFCLAAICIVVPQQMSDEMRTYGANIIVTPLAGEWKNGIDRAMVLPVSYTHLTLPTTERV